MSYSDKWSLVVEVEKRHLSVGEHFILKCYCVLEADTHYS